MTMLDVLPTFLEIAGTEHPGASNFRGRQINAIKGRSFWPYLTGESDTVHLPADPGETTDLAQREPALTAELVAEWEANWR